MVSVTAGTPNKEDLDIFASLEANKQEQEDSYVEPPLSKPATPVPSKSKKETKPPEQQSEDSE